MVRRGYLFCVALCVLICFPLVAFGNTIYENDFETGTLQDWLKWNFACSYSGSFDIVSQDGNNVLRYIGGNVAGGGDEAFVAGDMASADYAVEADVMLYDYVHQYMIAGIVARATDKDNMYIYTISASDQQNHSRAWIGKRVNGNPHLPLSCYTDVIQWMDIPINQEEWYRLKMEVVGNSIKCYIDGELIFDITDNDLTTGKFGVFSAATDARFDNIQVASLDEPMTSECSTPSEGPLFSEDFSQNLDEWQVGSLFFNERQNHNPTVIDGVYVAGDSGGNNAGHHIELPQPIFGSELALAFDARNLSAPGSGVNHLMLCTDDTLYTGPDGFSYCNGYNFNVGGRPAYPDGLITIRRIINGVLADLAYFDAPGSSDETWKNILIKRDENGNWSACMDGVPLEATFADADLAYTNFTYLSTNLDGPDPINAFDNIKIYGTPVSCPVSGELVIREDFNDNEISDWEDGSLWYATDDPNTPTAIDGVYIAGGGNQSGGHHKQIPEIGPEFTIKIDVRSRTDHGGAHFGIYTDNQLQPVYGGLEVANGYEITASSSSGYVAIRRLQDGDFTLVALTTAFPLDQDFHTVQVSRISDGTWQICVDGIPAEMDQNDADTTYQHFRYISIGHDANDGTTINALDNLEVFGVLDTACVASGELVFSEDFSSDFGDWQDFSLYMNDLQGHNPIISDGAYVAGDSGTNRAGHHIELPNPLFGNAFVLSVNNRSLNSLGNGVNHLMLCEDDTLYNGFNDHDMCNGYSFSYGSWHNTSNTDLIFIRKWENAQYTEVAEFSAPGIDDENWHAIQVIRDQNGDWTACMDGLPLTAIFAYNDLAYTNFTYLTTNLDNPNPINAFDDIKLYGTSSCPATGELVFSDDFDDNDISDWNDKSLWYATDNPNTPYVSDGVYVAGSGTQSGGHHKEIPAIGPEFTIVFDARSSGVFGQGLVQVGLFADNQLRPIYNGLEAANGYAVNLSSHNGNITIVKFQDGSFTKPARTMDFPLDQEFHTVQVTHLPDGTWEICVDGIPANMIQNDADTTYQTLRYVTVGLDANNNALDNLEVYAAEDIAENTPPILDPIGDKTVNEGELIEFVINASDADSEDILIYGALNLPPGATFYPDTRTFSWTPPIGQVGEYQGVMFTVTDNGDPIESDSETISITVNDVNFPPELDPIGDKSVNEGELLEFTVSANDPDGIGDLVYSVANIPEGANFDSVTRTFSWTPTFQQAGSYIGVDFRASDGLLIDSEFIIITVNNVNRLPVANDQSIVLDEDTTANFTLTATDADGQDLTYTVLSGPSQGTLSGTAPDLVYTPAADFNGTDSFTFKVNDSQADSNVATVSIMVDPVNDAPVLGIIGDKTLDESQTLTFTITGSDIDGDSLSFMASNLPAGATFDEASRSFSWTPTYEQSGVYTGVAFQVTDGQAIDSKAITITVINVNRMPVSDAGGSITVLSKDVSNTIINGTASDPDTGTVLSYRWLLGDSVILNWTTVAGTGHCPLDLAGRIVSVGCHTVTLEVKDESLTTSDQMTLCIENTAPNALAIGAGIYEIFTQIELGGQVSDFDGDVLSYRWLLQGNVLFSGSIATPFGEKAVTIPVHVIDDLGLGTYTLSLEVNDGVNASVTSNIDVEIVDVTPPTLAPLANPSVLWPPNHKMVDVVIDTNAADNSGGAVYLSATVSSNEPQNANGNGKGKKKSKGNKSPDWTEPEIDQENGIIYLQLRAERLGGGDGRIYTTLIEAQDQSGNMNQAIVEVIVPHSAGQKGGKHQHHSVKGPKKNGNHKSGSGKGKR